MIVDVVVTDYSFVVQQILSIVHSLLLHSEGLILKSTLVYDRLVVELLRGVVAGLGLRHEVDSIVRLLLLCRNQAVLKDIKRGL